MGIRDGFPVQLRTERWFGLPLMKGRAVGAVVKGVVISWNVDSNISGAQTACAKALREKGAFPGRQELHKRHSCWRE